MGAELISFTVSGSTKRTENFLRRMKQGDLFKALDSSAREGVSALIAGTPVDSGLAAESWSYEIERTSSSVTIKWTNNDVENGFPVGIMLQYGHGTGTGGYVQGQDYINPAMRPVFDRIAEQVWKAVTSA